MASDEETLYCLCRRPYEEDQFMIECEICKDWFHGSCVGIKELQAADIEIYHCPNCQLTKGPLLLKKRRNWHRRDYSETDEHVSKAVQTGTVVFIRELKNRTFPSADELPIVRLRGYEMTRSYLEENGFTVPILVDRKDGLDLKVPPPNFTIQDVENHVGSMREIMVIDVARQEDCKMLMREWTEYYNSPNRNKIYNVISLEFTGTKLAELVLPPRVVRELSWVSQYWPDDQPPEDVMYQRPEVQRYCLMGIKDSFTDFHVDFGGTSVWYHVLRGEKVFYLVRPTTANLALYEAWLSSSAQSEMFFGDQVDACYRCVVKQGQTLFIPCGWIHAVLTPIDSLVFGGNFLHSLAIDQQIQVYEIEKRVQTESKYLFPNFETVHWYAAKHLLDSLKELREDGRPIPDYLTDGVRSLATALKSWTHKKDYIKKDSIPETIQYGRLLKDLGKEVKQTTVKPMEDKAKKKKKVSEEKLPKSPGRKPKKSLGGPKTLGVPKTPGDGTKKSPGRKPKTPKTPITGPPLSPPPSPQVQEQPLFGMGSRTKTSLPETKPPPLAPPPRSSTDEPSDTDASSDPLRIRLPKRGAYTDTSVYDFSDEPDEGPSPHRPASPRSPRGSPRALGRALSPRATGPLSPRGGPLSPRGGPLSPRGFGDTKVDVKVDVDATPKLKLKVSGGKIVRGLRSPAGLMSPSSGDGGDISDTSDDESGHVTVDDVAAGGDSVRRPPERMFGLPGMGTGLKLKLPVTKPSAPPPSDPEDPEDVEPADFMDRLNMPTIRGGLNGSISDILEASGYGTETDFRTDEDINRASPTMRDAIQGMLSMSRIGMPSTLVTSASPAEKSRLARGRRSETGETEPTNKNMPTCFKDSEFVYPTLDVSDTEDDHVFKPRGRPRKDETWNPKAKLNPNCPKPERPHREGVSNEAVQSGLAAAAAKYAHLPPPKRQYVRRKPKPERQSSLSMDYPQGASSSLGAPLEVSLTGAKRPASSPPTSPVKGSAAKKPRKGMATAKQRLGKILKIHKMRM